MRKALDEDSDASCADRTDGEHDLFRPNPSTPLGERAREWIDWFGLVRLLTSAVAVVVVCVGAWFLLRTPPPPTEASLPVATPGAGGPTAPPATLPVATSPEGQVGPVSTAGASRVIVHVAGAVLLPGVYELAPGSRVDDAVRGAGGATGDAELGRINLAAPLVDGDQIYVPAEGEDVPPPAPASETRTAPGPAATGPVDVNRATAEQLEALPGVGPSTAAAIVAERERNGPFVSFDDLERVRGIGPAKLAGLVGLVAT